jgi:hypothetical protein
MRLIRGTYWVRITRKLPTGQVKTFSTTGLLTLEAAQQEYQRLTDLYPAQKTGPKPRRK